MSYCSPVPQVYGHAMDQQCFGLNAKVGMLTINQSDKHQSIRSIKGLPKYLQSVVSPQMSTLRWCKKKRRNVIGDHQCQQLIIHPPRTYIHSVWVFAWMVRHIKCRSKPTGLKWRWVINLSNTEPESIRAYKPHSSSAAPLISKG